jgi:hypothetical protein
MRPRTPGSGHAATGLPSPRWLSALAAVAVVVGFLGAGAPVAGYHYQYQGAATPGASAAASPTPQEAVCAVPTREPAAGSDGTGVGEGPVGSPPASPEGAAPVPAATPIASPGASAAAASAAADIEQTIRALAVCRSEGREQTVIDLTTAAYRGLITGAGTELPPDEYVALAELQPTVPITIRSVTDVRLEGPGEASAEVVSVFANQLLRTRVGLLLVAPGTDEPLADGGAEEPAARWVVDTETPLEVDIPEAASVVEVTLAEYEIAVDAERADGPEVVLAIANEGARAHEVLALRLDGGASVDALLGQPGPELPEGIAFAGQVSVGAGDEAFLVLVDLEPGDYALVDLFPSETGQPNLALGMRASLTIDD